MKKVLLLTVNSIIKCFLIICSCCLLMGCEKANLTSQLSHETEGGQPRFLSVMYKQSSDLSQKAKKSTQIMEFCDYMLEKKGIDGWVSCRNSVPEEVYMRNAGTILEPMEAEDKYIYRFEGLGIEMIVDFPFTDHIYVVEQEVPGNQIIGSIYVYENTKESGVNIWSDYRLIVEEMSEEEVKACEKDWVVCREIILYQLDENNYLVTVLGLGNSKSEYMQQLLDENLVSLETMDEFLEHAAFRWID